MVCPVLLCALLAAGPGRAEAGESRSVVEPDSESSIDITALDTYTVTFTDELLGLSFDDEGWPRLLAVSGADDRLYGLEPMSADSVDELALNAANQSGWGVAWLSSDLLYTNDTIDTALFGYDSVDWFTQENYAGDDGRGMDYCDDLFWQAVSQGSLHRVVSWDPMSGIWTWSDISAQIPGQLSGLTAFTAGTQSYICVTVLDEPDIWVFATTDREVSEFVGSAVLPGSAGTSLGLAYSEYFDNFYWCYTSGGSTLVSRFEMTIDSTPLDRASWGGIKALP